MTKLLLIFGIFFGILYFFYYKLRQFLRNVTGQFNETGRPNQSNPIEQRVDKGKMAKCPACGVYFPESTGIKKILHTGELYCSKVCADKGKSK